MGSMLSLGNFDTIGGKKVLTGGSLGLDVKEIIEGTVFPKKLEIEKIEDSLSITNKKSLVFKELSTYVKNLETSATSLKNAAGNNKDVFSKRNVSTTMGNGTAADNYISISAKNGAPIENFSIEVQKIAKAKMQQSWSFSSKTDGVTNDPSAPASGKFNAGIFQINGIDITLDVGDSLSTIQDKINAKSSATNVSAKIIQPDVGQYRLILESSLTGVENAYILNDPSNVLNNVFTQDPTNNPNLDVQAAQDAVMVYNGNITVTRPSNKITDFIDNITFTLSEETKAGDIINASISPDTKAAHDAITQFVENYNVLTIFIQQQDFIAAQKPDKDETNDEKTTRLANLKKDSLVKTIKSNVKNIITQAVEGLPDHNTLASIGITFAKKEAAVFQENNYTGVLVIDDNKLNSALSDNMEDVKKLFGLNFTSDSANLSMGAKRGTNINADSFKFDIDVNRADLNDRVRVTYTSPTDSSPVTINASLTLKNPDDVTQGYNIQGIAGTILENFDFSYTGNGVEIINSSITQGFGDKISNYISELNKEEAFTKAQKTLTDSVEKYKKEIEKKNEAMDKEREFLLNKYGKLEALFRELNSTLEFLEAQQQYSTK
ncbi:flagellar hook-associated 2 domain-containing protein [endosymbiont of Acanthamoeba sp. UWC8]|uniref:flagellar filament capping protein FliD n=1 Tax=endosymbiont of Acanthamoeba sp. UWC8 TaxID=86106 RepID=UPI0004D0F9D8|nr:flagellar filament capping protein FliD [endosymbiont of Acanthamoeba sp. UWC8]AIF81979.1 flagellar hook-associated 2 domain-containing protein [endosymbiont of Acanthamoeba sp. UWC8]